MEHHGFTRLYLDDVGPAQSNGDGEAGLNSLAGASDTSNGPNLNGTSKTLVARRHDASFSLQSGQKPPAAHTFATAEELLSFVTLRWRQRFVTTAVRSEAELDIYQRRPFFLLVSVDAPLTVRWARYQERHSQSSAGSSSWPGPIARTLDEFAALSDAHLYSAHGGLLPLISQATVRLLNTTSSLPHLYATLGKLDLASPARLRPTWDAYFMALASLAAQRSNCMKRRVGCVLVRDHRVLSTGYNGTPRGIRNCADGGCGRCNAGDASGVSLSTCLCIHAEENALLEAGRERIGHGEDGDTRAVLYCNTCPCLTCSIKIAQVGIREVVYAQGYSMDNETAAVFREAGVRLRQFIPVSLLSALSSNAVIFRSWSRLTLFQPANGLIHLERVDDIL